MSFSLYDYIAATALASYISLIQLEEGSVSFHFLFPFFFLTSEQEINHLEISFQKLRRISRPLEKLWVSSRLRTTN